MTLIDRLLSVPSSGTRLGAMEGLRGYAALLIYVLHLTGQYCNRRFGLGMDGVEFSALSMDQPWLILAYWLHSSHYGVDIFFALSGYLIAGIVARENFSYGPYVINRLLRIYPVLITSTFIYVGYQIVVHGGAIWWGGVAGNLLLLNGLSGLDFPAINIVTWSLFFEVTFYLVFPLLWRGCGQRLTRFVAVSLCIVVLLAVVSDNYSRYAMFVVGVVLKMLPQHVAIRLRQSFSDTAVALLFVMATAMFMVTKQFVSFLPIFVIPAFLFLDRVIHANGWLNGLFSNRCLRYAGNISFSFYIYHPLALRLTHSILERYTGWTDIGYLAALILLSLLLSTTLAVLSYVFIERLYFSSRRHAAAPRPQRA